MNKSILFSLLIMMLGLLSCASHQIKLDDGEISFMSGENRLYGKLLMPHTKKKVPAVVFLVGSGGESSYKSNYKKFLKENLEDIFLDEGIALFYFDKRGVNNSEGDWEDTDFYERADDAEAAIHYLKSLPRIDSTRIGVIGHSQGGWISQIVAGRNSQDIAFAVSISGSTRNVFDQLVRDYQSEFECLREDENTAYEKAVDKTESTMSWMPWISFLKDNWTQLNLIKNFDPAEEISNIKIPFLFMFAENDELVDTKKSIKRLKEIFNNDLPYNIFIQIIKDANHSMRISPKCFSGNWNELQYSKQFQESLRIWVLNKVCDCCNK